MTACKAMWEEAKAKERNCHGWGCSHCSKNPNQVQKQPSSLGRLDTDGSISFVELAKDCPARNKGDKCTLRTPSGNYYSTKCAASQCSTWHFIKAMMVEK